MKIKNKKAASKIISMYWFVMLLIIAGGIFAMVYSFYHHPYDVRELEGKIMANHIADCLSFKGKLNSVLFDEEDFNKSFETSFLDNCHINLDVEETFEKEPQYYFKVKFYNATDLDNSVFEITKGNLNLPAGCEIQNEKEYKREVKCINKSFFSYHNQNLYLIKILTIIKKTKKNVK